MSNSMWGALERPFDIHKHLASALNDAQYWDESISPTQIRTELSSNSPIRSMKWLLASISKGRDVSDFYPDVIKLVGHSDLQVRKLVYTYMNQHCNDAKYQELSLLSINSLQRGLDDKEPLIRAMAIRAMGSLGLPDVLQIQQLGISKRIADKSPYVRKCAVTAASKLKSLELLDLVVQVLHRETATMVLGSAVIAFYELTDSAKTEYLKLLHPCFRKLCILLTDMDEYAQVVCLEVLTRYCRNFFREPRCYRNGSAEAIDATRRVVRDATGAIVNVPESTTVSSSSIAAAPITPLTPDPLPRRPNQRIIKRRIVKKGFYSDEEDESTEEEVYADTLESVTAPISLREPEATMSPDEPALPDAIDKEEADLDEDHRRLLTAAMPLLKSRNAGVVLAVCALQFYCGVSSVRIRKSMGKALVRIHRDPETQYVVYTSIRRLVRQCPSAFSPFLHDFFVLQMDPPQTRAAKLDILTSLALDPPSIEKVLTELRHYIQWQPQNAKEVEFACAAISAVGRVAELAKICYTRQSRGSEATNIVINCLFGLVTVSTVMTDSMIVGEAVIVMQRILKLLQPGITPDPKNIRTAATKRILLLLFNTLTKICEFEESEAADDDDEEDSDDDDEQEESHKRWANAAAVLPPSASAAAIHWLAELLVSNDCYLENHHQIRTEVARLLANSFVELENAEKDQAMFYSFQLLLCDNPSDNERRLSERVLALGRVDPNTDTRDCARTFSNFIHISAVGLQFDKEALDEPMFQSRIENHNIRKSFSTASAYPSYLPFEKEVHYRFGSLSSLMGHKAHASYRPLPEWATENSPSSIREEVKPDTNGSRDTFYRNEDTSSDSSEYGDDEGSSSSSSLAYDRASNGNESSSSSDDSSESSEDSESDDETDSGSDDEHKTTPAAAGTLLSPFVSNSIEAPGGLLSGMEQNNNAEKLISFEPLMASGQTAASIAGDLRGLVLEPKISTVDQHASSENDFGAWFGVIRPDHSGGLAVRARYLRGETKSKHATSVGLLPGSASLVVVQFLFEHVKGSTPFRHIRIVQRTSTSSSSVISPSRVLAPPEKAILNVGEETKVVVCINFSGSSDRDGSLLAKLEVKFGSGGMPFEIRPNISDLLLPCTRSIAEFDASVGRMHGFNRLETKIACSKSIKDATAQLLIHSSLTLLKSRNGESDQTARLAGSLPSSTDPIFVQVDAVGNEIKLVVCCEHALVLSPMLNQLKKALTKTKAEDE